MDVFRVRDRLIDDYREFTGSFVDIHDKNIREHVAEKDASLQAGHFNDFVQVSQLRGALYRALDKARKCRAFRRLRGWSGRRRPRLRMISAQKKAGKTTLGLNLIRAR